MEDSEMLDKDEYMTRSSINMVCSLSNIGFAMKQCYNWSH